MLNLISRADAAEELRAFGRLAEQIRFGFGGSAEKLLEDLDDLAVSARTRANEIVDPKRRQERTEGVFLTGSTKVRGRRVIVEKRRSGRVLEGVSGRRGDPGKAPSPK
jgi:hypothetical protein